MSNSIILLIWVGRDPKDHQVPILLPQSGLPAARSSTRLDQITQGLIQPGLKYLQGRGTHSLSGQLFQHLTTFLVYSPSISQSTFDSKKSSLRDTAAKK